MYLEHPATRSSMPGDVRRCPAHGQGGLGSVFATEGLTGCGENERAELAEFRIRNPAVSHCGLCHEPCLRYLTLYFFITSFGRREGVASYCAAMAAVETSLVADAGEAIG